MGYIVIAPVGDYQSGTDVEAGIALISKPKMYNIIDGDFDRHRLKLIAKKGFTVNAFTFG